MSTFNSKRKYSNLKDSAQTKTNSKDTTYSKSYPYNLQAKVDDICANYLHKYKDTIFSPVVTMFSTKQSIIITQRIL